MVNRELLGNTKYLAFYTKCHLKAYVIITRFDCTYNTVTNYLQVKLVTQTHKLPRSIHIFLHIYCLKNSRLCLIKCLHKQSTNFTS
jgi:hypothetical protein